MASSAENLVKRAQALESAASSKTGALAALEDYFGVAEAAFKAEFIIDRVARRRELTGLIRSILESAWSRSGLDRDSDRGKGQLYSAAVKNSAISATAKGIRIALAPGSSKQLYAWAGAQLFGSVHIPLGDRAKRSIKKAVSKSLAKGASHSTSSGVRKARNFWHFSDAEISAVAALWVQLYFEEVTDVIRQHKALKPR